MNPIKLTERISYFPSVEKPLSSDVIMILGDSRLYVFDVGNNDEATNYLNSLDMPKTVFLSHFHSDHTAHLDTTVYDELYVGNLTNKVLHTGTVVAKPLTIEDGVRLTVVPVSTSHAKGSLLLMVDEDILFTGDATYAVWSDNRTLYNSQLLKEEISILSALPAPKYFLSHNGGKLRKKETVLRLLNDIYAKRLKDSPWIALTDSGEEDD